MSKFLRIGISIPLLCMALLITSCTLDRSTILSLLADSAQTTQATPTSIPPAQVGGTTQRIRFASGATSAQVSGQINGTIVNTYLLDAIAGQEMRILVSSPYSNVYLTVVSPTGIPLARAQAGAQSFDQTLPENGDYTLQVSAPAGTATTTYILNVSVIGGQTPSQPNNQRIRFPAGATSTSVSGQVSGNSYAGYVLEARAGQRMQITIASSGSALYLTVVSPNGTPLARAQAGAQSFDQTLPENGDYTIQVSAPAGTPTTNYTLNVSVTNGASGGITQRITFAPGATSASVSGQIGGTAVDTYLLEAYVGQNMQVTLSSPSGTAYLNVIAPDGSPLARAQAGAQSFSGALPTSGDYQLQVMLLGSTVQTSYTLNVSVTGSGGLPGGTTQRIHFATGATSATVNGRIDGVSMDNYLLEAQAGQYMQVTVASPAGEAYLTLVSPSGSPMARAQAGAQSFSGSLPETGDYRLTISSPSGTAHTTYTMTVSVTGSASSGGSSGVTQRIHFASGATGTSVSGNVGGSAVDTYLLDASAGQFMQVSLASPSGTAYLNVVSPGGSPLARAQAGAQGFSGTLPESGDYQLQVMTLGGSPTTSYTLTVSVTG